MASSYDSSFARGCIAALLRNNFFFRDAVAYANLFKITSVMLLRKRKPGSGTAMVPACG